MLTAIFIYWGWDTAVSVNEETDDPEKTPGRAAIISTVLLLVTYALVAVATIAFAGVGDKGIGLGNADNAPTSSRRSGRPCSATARRAPSSLALLGISILTSASASTQTTILPTARTSLSMAVYKALPNAFAQSTRSSSPRPGRPSAWASISVAFYLIFTLISVDLLSALIGSIGLMIAFYYGLTGFACVWYYRKTLFHRADFIMRGLFPLLGGRHADRRLRLRPVQFALPDWLTDDGRQERHHLRHRCGGGRRHRRPPRRSRADGGLACRPARVLPRRDAGARSRRPRALSA